MKTSIYRKSLPTHNVVEPLSIELDAHDVEYKAGETLELFCEAVPASDDVTLTWLKDGEKLEYSDSVISIEYG